MSLTPSDVPGAIFVYQNVEDHSVLQLRRWLECRGLQKNGNKSQLIERCKDCIAAGRADVIHVGVDVGKWYNKKFPAPETIPVASTSTAPATLDSFISTAEQWAPFPSQNIPEMFNKGHIYAYLVLNAPTQNTPDSDSENDDIPATEKPFRRGQQYVDSDFVHKVCDRIFNKNYNMKCIVNSSFKKKSQNHVELTLCILSGSVLNGRCHCKQSALGRCSHVSAALLYIWKHVQQYGYKAKSCTSLPQLWGRGAKQSNPSSITTATYPVSLRMRTERVNFDPRPTNYSNAVNINEFLYNLELAGEVTMFQSLFSYEYEDFDYTEDEKNLLSDQCNIFMNNLIEYVFKNSDCIVELPGTIGQGDSEKWLYLRSYFITASNAKLVCSLQSTKAKANYIRHHLWYLDDFQLTKAMKYGINNEKRARDVYKTTLGKDELLKEMGLVVNRKYPFLGCSVDGIVVNNNDNKKIRIIEIKCPYMLENDHPKDFKIKLSKKQLQSFCLDEENGNIIVKRNHTYYYQMQIGMLIHDVETCDFILWSNSGILKVPVCREPINSVFMQDCLNKIEIFYKKMYIPEMFCMRVPRKLLPLLFST